MKTIFLIWLSLFWTGSFLCYSQGCPSNNSDITHNSYVCGLYGDDNGNPNWNWELPSSDPNYCTMWYARTDNSGNETVMGSPFVTGTTNKLEAISLAADYTHAKGWELLRRDFGCTHVTAYPYFVLYNRYTGLMRVFVYQPAPPAPQYTGITVQVEPTTTTYPATTATADQIQTAPDKYLNSNSSSGFGKIVECVSEPAGSSRWSVAEFDPGFDPNIYSAIYSTAGLKFTIYGITTYALQAKINGTTVTGNASNLSMAPKSVTTNPGGSTSILADSSKFTTWGKDINDLRTSINSTVTGIASALDTADPKGPNGSIQQIAARASAITSDPNSFSAYVGDFAGILSDLGGVFKAAGALISLFSGSSAKASSPTFTNYNLTLTGSLTAQNVEETFILRVPGTDPGGGDNATYYQCPLGIFNLNATPEADTVVYTRPYVANPNSEDVTQIAYAAYKFTNNIPVTWADGAGLDLVSVQAAIMIQILPGSNGNASYNPLQQGQQMIGAPPLQFYITNFVLPDIEAGRLQFALYDTSAKHLHLLQTPYVNLECLPGMSVNVPNTSKVFLRVKAVLKQKSDASSPIAYVQDYAIKCNQGTLAYPMRQTLNGYSGAMSTPPPYANYTQMPSYIPDRTFTNYNFNSPQTVEADNSITLGSSVGIFGQNVVMEAGNAVYLNQGFTTLPGSSFVAMVDNFGATPPSCGTLNKTAFEPNSNCYNTTLYPQSQKPGPVTATPSTLTNIDSAINVYPNPASQQVLITGLDGLGHATFTVVDLSGRTIYTVEKQDDSPTMELNVTGLSNGVYFVQIKGTTRQLIRKIIVAH